MVSTKAAMVDTKRNPKGERGAQALHRRRTHGRRFKRRIINRSLEPGVSVARIALEHQLNANLAFKWRREHLRPLATPAPRQANAAAGAHRYTAGVVEAG